MAARAGFSIAAKQKGAANGPPGNALRRKRAYSASSADLALSMP